MTTHRDRYPIRVGALLWPQQTDWAQTSEYARLADRVGLDSLWTWDHLHAIVGDPLQPIFEGWTTLAAWATETEHIQLGLMVGANTFRNPGLTAKSAVTVDHISKGRTWLGLGGAWFEYEHTAAGIDFGTGFGQRLDWFDEAVNAITRVMAGEAVTSAPGGRYQFKELEHHPLPFNGAGMLPLMIGGVGETVTSEPGGRYQFKGLEHHPLPFNGAGMLPLMIGGVGEKKTLRTVATYAQGWNAGGNVETLTHKVEVLKRHCEAVGRDPLEIEFTTNRYLVLRDDPAEAERVLAAGRDNNGSAHKIDPEVDFLGTEEQVAEQWRQYLDLGFTHVNVDFPSPYDRETMERLPRLRELVAEG